LDRVKNKVDFGKVSAEGEPDKQEFYQVNDSHHDCYEEIEAKELAQESNHKSHSDKNECIKFVLATEGEVYVCVAFANQQKERK